MLHLNKSLCLKRKCDHVNKNERSFGDPRYVNVFLVEMDGFTCGLLLRLKVQLETFDDTLLCPRYVRIESSDKALLSIVTDIVSSLFQPRVLLQCFRLAVKNVLVVGIVAKLKVC